ncbi:pentapeptide repeat-containing protein [Dictyobacter kobayashii]|uniref:Pentapeptide repeat-containing protein n=1 Tax=Dictyobacter kobayashii TaxID=2014872 RepID=A0A402AYI0_9CHLR|nr:pentapeptide repeat-containing protein [Dictyobacter kobayashii]GCE24113.1 hypothetical protein KDK_79130 [Dictyobacter kobayashii]
MSNPEHVEIFKQGVEVWNRWRNEHRAIMPDLSGEDFSGAQLDDVRLSFADLRGTRFHAAQLQRAYFVSSNLSEADFSQAQLIEGHLDSARIMNANFCQANLQRAKVRQAKLYAANLNGADLRHANLSRAGLSSARLDGADFSPPYWIGTSWSMWILARPEDLKPPSIKVHPMSGSAPWYARSPTSLWHFWRAQAKALQQSQHYV